MSVEEILATSEPEVERSQRVEYPGITVEYEPHPKRLYRVNDVERPSVTTVLDILMKQALIWWAMKVGIVGVVELLRRALLEDIDLEEVTLLALADKDHPLMKLMKEHGLTTNQTRDKAGTRGTSVHRALEGYVFDGTIPDPEKYAEEERGYVTGLAKFLEITAPQPILSEVIVGSAEHGYAGRFDLTAYIKSCEVSRGRKKDIILPEGTYLLDLKTSKYVSENHFLQLEAYERAARECGLAQTQYRGVIHVTQDGEWNVVRSKAYFEDFLAVLEAYRALRRVKERK